MTKFAITTAYKSQRVNKSTFLIIHKDIYRERPFIYIKLFNVPPLAVVFDTGCGSTAAADPGVHITDLVDFIETYPNAENGFRPLNPRIRWERNDLVGQRKYLILCSHVHFDHIGGIESFSPSQSQIWASGYDADFLARKNREKNSLCSTVGMPLPNYEISHFVKDTEHLEINHIDLGLNLIHTPGHTPDSLTVWDENERWLYTGDSFYCFDSNVPGNISVQQPILFPPQGNLQDYMTSLKKMQKLLEHENSSRSEGGRSSDILIGCGHNTVGVRASYMLPAVQAFFEAVIDCQIPVIYREERYGEVYAMWGSNSDTQLSHFRLFAPERLFLEYRRKLVL